MRCLVAIVSFFSVHCLYGYGLPGVSLGFTNILDGGPIRPNPGAYWFQYVQYYTTKRFLDGEGKSLGGLPSPRFRLFDTITQLVYNFDQQPIVKGMPGVSVSLPLVMYSHVGKNEVGLASSGSGFGNLGFGLYVQWNVLEYKGRPFFIHRLNFDFAIPLGKNKLPEKNINPSDTFFSCNTYWAATVYLTHKWTISWRWYYIWNAANEKINYQAGDATIFNYSMSYQAVPNFYVAAVGYVLEQLHNDRAGNVAVPNSKQRVFGIGPGAAYFVSKDLVFLGYLYLEAGARNRSEGTNCIVRVVKHF